jgi:NAD(P)H-dependent FMN reductase
MKILCLAGSLRAESLNKKLATWASRRLSSVNPSAVGSFVDIKTLQIPLYDGDLDAKGSLPDVQKLAELITQHHGLIVSTPEYNGSIPGVLKNLIDWLSRSPLKPLAGKPVLLLSASPGGLGGVRGLWHTRVPFEAVGSFVVPSMFGLPMADKKFDPSGNLSDDDNKKLDPILQNFLTTVEKLIVK